MTKQELINKLMSKTKRSVTRADMNRIVNGFCEEIMEALAVGESVPIAGFGTFKVSERAAREGRNPATGESLHIEACKVPKFKSGKAFKQLVNK